MHVIINAGYWVKFRLDLSAKNAGPVLEALSRLVPIDEDHRVGYGRYFPSSGTDRKVEIRVVDAAVFLTAEDAKAKIEAYEAEQKARKEAEAAQPQDDAH